MPWKFRCSRRISRSNTSSDGRCKRNLRKAILGADAIRKIALQGIQIFLSSVSLATSATKVCENRLGRFFLPLAGKQKGSVALIDQDIVRVQHSMEPLPYLNCCAKQRRRTRDSM